MQAALRRSVSEVAYTQQLLTARKHRQLCRGVLISSAQAASASSSECTVDILAVNWRLSDTNLRQTEAPHLHYTWMTVQEQHGHILWVCLFFTAEYVPTIFVRRVESIELQNSSMD